MGNVELPLTAFLMGYVIERWGLANTQRRECIETSEGCVSAWRLTEAVVTTFYPGSLSPSTADTGGASNYTDSRYKLNNGLHYLCAVSIILMKYSREQEVTLVARASTGWSDEMILKECSSSCWLIAQNGEDIIRFQSPDLTEISSVSRDCLFERADGCATLLWENNATA